jgi:hypothetical protein
MTFNPLAKLDLGLSDADLEGIEEAYKGPDLPARRIGPGYLSRVYIDNNANGNPMLKVLYKSTMKLEAKDGSVTDYTGFAVWENYTLTPAGAFKWKELIELLGITPKDLNALKCNPNEQSNAGFRVTQFGKLDVSEELDIYFSVVYEKYTDPDTGEVSRTPRVHFMSRVDESE